MNKSTLALLAILLFPQCGLAQTIAGAPPTSSGANTLTGNILVYGMTAPSIALTQTGTPGSTTYIYTVVGKDVFTHTYAQTAATATGNATLSDTNYNVVTIGAFSKNLPFLLPTGGCDIYRVVGGATTGRIATNIECVTGAVFNDTGIAAEPRTTPPYPNTSGVVSSVNGPFGNGGVCVSTSAPAVCGGAQIGFFVVAPAGTVNTVNTFAVNANSQILVIQDDALGSRLGVTCYNGANTNPRITARTNGVSFSIAVTAPVTNPACYSYLVVN